MKHYLLMKYYRDPHMGQPVCYGSFENLEDYNKAQSELRAKLSDCEFVSLSVVDYNPSSKSISTEVMSSKDIVSPPNESQEAYLLKLDAFLQPNKKYRVIVTEVE